MTIKERFLNVLDGVLLVLAMAWTVTIATHLLHPSDARISSELRAPITTQAGDL